jgi:hypothetical protein
LWLETLRSSLGDKLRKYGYDAESSSGSVIKTINLKTEMPTVAEALQHLDRELARCRQGSKAIKLIHGYGSSGEGGEIRIAVQRQLTGMAARGEIRACIFGENWSKSDEQAWALMKTHPELKQDPDLGKQNRGITIVVL